LKQGISFLTISRKRVPGVVSGLCFCPISFSKRLCLGVAFRRRPFQGMGFGGKATERQVRPLLNGRFPLAFFRDGSLAPYRRLLAFTACIWREQPFSLALLPEAGSPKELTFRQCDATQDRCDPPKRLRIISTGGGNGAGIVPYKFVLPFEACVALALSQAKERAATTSSGASGAEIADVFLQPVYVPAMQDSLAASVASLLQKEAGAAGN